MVDVESASLSNYASDEVKISALYFVSDIVGSEHESLSEDDSSGRADKRVEAASYILQSLGLENSTYPQAKETTKKALIQNALENDLPKKAGAIDRLNVLRELLPSIEFQDESFTLTSEWLSAEVKKLSRSIPSIDDSKYFEFSVKVAEVIRWVSTLLNEKELFGYEFYVTKSFHAYKADPSQRVSVKVCNFNPSDQEVAAGFQTVKAVM